MTDTAAGYIFASTEIDPDTCTLNTSKIDCFGFTYEIPSSLLHNYLTISASICTKDRLTDGQFLRIRQAIALDPLNQFKKATVE